MNRLILVLLSSSLLLSCSKETLSAGGEEGKSLRHAYSLLNQKRETEALSLANSHLRLSPNSSAWLTVKAEAYVSQAGLRADSLIALAEKLEALSEMDNSFHKSVQLEFLEEMKSSSDKNVQNIAVMFKEFLNVLDSLSIIYVSFNSISDIPVEKISTLANASVILSQIKPIADDTRIFRAVVNLLILKFKIKYNYYFEQDESKSCLIAKALSPKLDELNFDLYYISNDLKALYPDSKTFSNISPTSDVLNLKNIRSSWNVNERESLELLITLFQRVGSSKKEKRKEVTLCL